jgi:deoxyribodipyrimidine photolyase
MATIKTNFKKQDLADLQNELKAAGINIISLSRSSEELVVETDKELTAQQKTIIESRTNLAAQAV